ncbi:MAG: hypothetical protein L0Y55_15935, partial [Anaerolineales bacterium]|nr:hypothetical protein [Anaerolineales bacterium]
MKTSRVIFCLSCLLILSALLGCQSAKPTPDAQATINAAVLATTVAQVSAQATIDAAVKATTAAQPTPTQPKATPGAPTAATATKVPAVTPVPTVNATTMTEEEIAALIDQAVNEAVAATNTTTTQTATYAADGTLTPQEVAAMQAAVTLSQSEINQALALTQAYYDLYYDLATETLNVLKAIEQDLNSMATSMNSMAQSLTQISTTLAQGQAVTASTIAQLQSNATKASQAAASAQGKEKNWNATVQSDLNKRATAALATKPTSAPTDLRGTAQSVNTYIETVRAALGDNKIGKSELQTISVAGANAVAGLNQFGGAQGQTLANSINTMTKQLARGEAPKAKSSLG